MVSKLNLRKCNIILTIHKNVIFVVVKTILYVLALFFWNYRII